MLRTLRPSSNWPSATNWRLKRNLRPQPRKLRRLQRLRPRPSDWALILAVRAAANNLRATGAFIDVIEVDVTAVNNQEVFKETVMKKTMLLILVVLVAASVAMAQTYTMGSGITGIDKLGAHQNGGRGCTGCHAPHSGARGNGGSLAGTGTLTGNHVINGVSYGGT